jgi:hypothetical protein
MPAKAVAVIGASAEDGKIGNSVMKNLINGGYKGEIYPIHPKGRRDLVTRPTRAYQGRPRRVRHCRVRDSRANFVAARSPSAAEKKVVGASWIPSGYAEPATWRPGGNPGDRPEIRIPP